MTTTSKLYGDDGKPLAKLHHLRQQIIKTDGKPNFSLADFVAPKDSEVTDYVGGFITTAGIGAEEVAKAYQDAGDDYNSIMVKALADRLAEACAEWLHQQVRKEHWGYAKDETLDNEALIKEQYSGIRPAPGYPACPDHTEKATLFALLDPEAERNAGRPQRRVPHRALRDVPGGGGQRLVLRPPAGAVLCRGQDRQGPGAELHRRAKARS